jgi:hypothetical protein
LVSIPYKQLKERCPLIELAVRQGQGAQLETWLEDGSVDLAIPYRTNSTPKNGDVYLVETSTYLVSTGGDPLTSRPTVPVSALHNLPLALFLSRERLAQPGDTADRKIWRGGAASVVWIIVPSEVRVAR